MGNIRNKKEADKAVRERQIFREFAQMANAELNLQLDIGSIKSETPPYPDISCNIKGARHFFEMVEVTDEDLARDVGISIREMKITGGAFSQDVPLIKAFASKAQKSYPVLDGPLELLAYYDKQYPPPVVGVQQTTLSEVHSTIQNMASNLNWDRFWVFDTWDKQIFGVYPSEKS